MIQKFVDKFEQYKHELEDKYSKEHPGSYKAIVRDVFELLGKEEDDSYDDLPDATRLTEIDHGEYQGTLVYVVGAKGYQPSTYWYVQCGYGSCSCCDTLQGIEYECGSRYDEDGNYIEHPNKEQTKEYLTLALHIVQRISKMYPDKGEI